MFPKAERLLSRADFQRMKKAPSVAEGRLVLAFAPSKTGMRRVGITVSSRVGNAVVRNRVKRWLREVVRTEKNVLCGMDVVLVARPGLEKLGIEGVRRSFLAAAARAGEAR